MRLFAVFVLLIILNSAHAQKKIVDAFYIHNNDTIKGHYANANINSGCIAQYIVYLDSFIYVDVNHYPDQGQYQIEKSAYLHGFRKKNPDSLVYRQRTVLQDSGCYENGRRTGIWSFLNYPPYTTSWCKANQFGLHVSFTMDTVKLFSSYNSDFQVAYLNDSSIVHGSIRCCLHKGHLINKGILLFSGDAASNTCRIWLSEKPESSINVQMKCLDTALFVALNVFSWDEFVETLDWICQEKISE